MGREAGRGAAPGEAATAGGASPSASRGGRPRRAALGGRPAQDRELRAQGRQTLRNLLEAGLAEFDERGFQAVRVDDIVRRAQISHGTFYLYFSNKEDLFKALLRDALHDMSLVTDEFPVVTRNAAGLAALRRWVHEFCETYAAHAAVIRTLSQAEIVGEEVWGDGLKLLFRLAEAMAQGMTAATGVTSRSWVTAASASPAAGTPWTQGVYPGARVPGPPRPRRVRSARISVTAASASLAAAASWTRKSRAPSQAHTASTARVPSPRSATPRPRVSPTKSLFDAATSTGHPVPARSAVRRVSSSECQVFFPKSCAGSMTIRSARTPAATARSASAVSDAITWPVRSGWAGRCGRVRGAAPPACAQTRPRSWAAATCARPGSAPPQASLSRSAPAAATASPTGARQVSTLMTTEGCLARSAATNGTTRRISSATLTSSPGPAFTPPRSRMPAPARTARSAAVSAASSS